MPPSFTRISERAFQRAFTVTPPPGGPAAIHLAVCIAAGT
jgi:hypothetical protein